MAPNRIVLAEYFTTDDTTLLFGVRADWDEPKVVEIKQPLSEIRKYVAENFSLEQPNQAQAGRSTHSKVRNLDLDEWQNCFGPFVTPILEWAEPGDYLYLVPHDVLHYLPLHTLKVEGGCLIERNPVLYTPSASVLKYCQAKRKGRREKALILGDSDAKSPLPVAREEARQVAKLFKVQPYLGHEAKKSLVKEKLEKEREEIDILHFACHGYFHSDQPLKSGILMAPEDEEDGVNETETTLYGMPIYRFLTAEEFFGIEMHADLVTLSACESGVNQLKPGDELFGLMRALIYAGTPSVVMSLWAVDEISTSLLMQKFYTALRDGVTKVQALQSAQLAIKKTTAREAIDYCEKILQNLYRSDPPIVHDQLTEDIANLHFQAHNYPVARELYTALRSRWKPDDQPYHRLAAAITWCNRAEQFAGAIDYEKQVYSHPYHWAPFVLVGDWK